MERIALRTLLICAAAVGLAAPATLCGQDAETGRSHLPPPDIADARYGPDAQHTLDVWFAHAREPAPVLVYFHGGGFVAGSKENLPAPLLSGALRAGITVVAANYRLAPHAVFPDNYLDCARVVQFTRRSAGAWHIDPRRVGLTGSSAGGAASLWIAFHDDLADPKSGDPVARESTRVACAAVVVAQPTYDPRVIRQLAGPAAARHPVFLNLYGLKPEEADSDRAHRLYREAAPITYLTKDDPPVWAYYGGPLALPPPDARAGDGIHHPNLGIYLKQRMDAAGVECVLRLKSDGGNATDAEIDFLRRHLGGLERPHRLLFIPQETDTPFWAQMRAGAEKAAQELSRPGEPVQIDWQGPAGPADLKTQLRLVGEASPNRCDAVLISSLDRQELVAPIERALRRGLVAVAVEAGVDSSRVGPAVGDTNFAAGHAAAERLGAALGGRGNVLLFRHHINAADTEQREQGFLQGLQEDWPRIRLLVTDFHAGPSPAIAARVVPLLIGRFKDRLDGIFASSETAGSVAAAELQRLGLTGRVKLMGIDDRGDGSVPGAVGLDPEKIGRLAVERAVALLDGHAGAPARLPGDPLAVVASGHGILVVPSVGLVMVGIPPGTFAMGSVPPGRDFRDTDTPGRRVAITRPFWLGMFELTQREWKLLMPRNPSDFAGDEHPVDNISWPEAVEFCRRLTRREAAAGRLPTGYAYQLPTEAQWEYACRAGSSGARAGDLDQMAWYVANSGSWAPATGPVSRNPGVVWQMGTHPVGQKTPNAWGLYDMYGNVLEWCFDRYGPYPAEAGSDPTGAAAGEYRVARGGGWWTDAEVCFSYSRTKAPPARHHDAIGFRVALSPVMP